MLASISEKVVPLFDFVPNIACKTYESKPVLLLRSEEDLDVLVVPKILIESAVEMKMAYAI